MKKIAVIAILLAVAATAGAKEGATVRSIALPVVETPLADGEGKLTVMSNCGSCHSLDYLVTQPRLSPAAWTAVVEKMRKVYGAEISDADAVAVASYLASGYGTEKKAAVGEAAGKGPAPKAAAAVSGEASFRKYCNACHAGGGNIVKPALTLHRKDLESNGIRTAGDIVGLLRDPGPGMPKFDEKSVPEAEARAIAEYVLKTFK
jgi:cytochrome c6